MELLQAMRERHSVRAYTDKPIEGKVKEDLLSFVEKCNKQSGLHMPARATTEAINVAVV